MKVNINLELSDEERNQFAVNLDGKEGKRLATRKDVVLFVQQRVAEFLQPQRRPIPDRSARSAAPRDDLGPRPAGEETAGRAVVEPSPDIPCNDPLTEKDFPRMLADFYLRAARGDEDLASYIVWECQRNGVKVKCAT